MLKILRGHMGWDKVADGGGRMGGFEGLLCSPPQLVQTASSVDPEGITQLTGAKIGIGVLALILSQLTNMPSAGRN